MSFVVPHRVNDAEVNNFYEKVATEGDASDFTSEAPGKQAALPWSAGVLNTQTGGYEFDLPFNYLVNQNQLQVFWEQNNLQIVPNVYSGWGLVLNLETAKTIPTFDVSAHPHYVELSSSRVALYNIEALAPAPYVNNDPTQPGEGANNSFLFAVPHTALPGAARDRLVVENQGDNVGIELQGTGDGISLRSPGGKTFLVRVNEAGVITSEEIR